MRLEKDFAELLELFNKHNVKYCIVGAFALAFHAHPRYTKDMDLLVQPTAKNGERIVTALRDFGFGSLRLTPEDFTEPEQVIQLGYPPLRIDLLTSLSGVDFPEVWAHRVSARYGSINVNFISSNDLIKAKSTTGRPQDEVDVQHLRAIIHRGDSDSA
ncbi:MAG: DUF6036 family nucleotidyltransferase [bacterium]